MIDIDKLKGQIKCKQLTQEKVATKLGVTPKTFGSWLKKGVIGSDYIDKLINLLEISNPSEIFFA